MNGDRLLYAFTQHPDKASPLARRHLVAEADRSRTLCGRPANYLWDWSTPLSLDCRACARAAETADAARR